MSNREHYTPEYMNHGGRNSYQGSPSTVYIVKQKSLLIAYILWFFLGVWGIHKLYLRQPMMFVLYLLLLGIGWLTTPILIGWVFLFLLGVLMVIDLFTMPIRVGILNSRAYRY